MSFRPNGILSSALDEAVVDIAHRSRRCSVPGPVGRTADRQLAAGPNYFGSDLKMFSDIHGFVMKRENILKKTAVRCISCQSIFSAEIETDGGVFLIGIGERCQCGGNDFRSFA